MKIDANCINKEAVKLIDELTVGIYDDSLSVIYWNPTHTKLVVSNWLKSVCTPTGKKCTEMRELLNFV